MTQRPLCPLQKGKISFQNWTRWLGKDEFVPSFFANKVRPYPLISKTTIYSYYSSYLVFFTEEIQKYGVTPTLERYLFKFREGKLLVR